MKLSIIISAYDRHDITTIHVRECMNSIRLPDEIIVVNDGGSDDLKDMLLKLDIKCKIIYAKIHENIEWNYTGARNLGVWLSSGDVLSMEDTDNIPNKRVYGEALKVLESGFIGRVICSKRPKVSIEDIMTKPQVQWPVSHFRPYHRDTQFIPRSIYLQLKGCDERFAGRYAWACADWRRRLLRANIPDRQIEEYYYAVVDGDTKSLIRRKSYTNYELAREDDGHIQSPKGILNFTYNYEIL